MPENIMCSSQKANSKKFEENYDRVFGEKGVEEIKNTRIEFIKSEFAHRYINGQLVDDAEWEKRFDCAGDPFMEIERTP